MSAATPCPARDARAGGRRRAALWRALGHALLVAACLLPGCATPGATEDRDPWEWMNRKTFWFNERLDEYVLEPTARGWDTITSPEVRRSVDRFFTNLRFPIHLLNNLLQAEFADAAGETGRFVVNTTVGLLGFFDPATDWGLQAHPEDLGQTFAVWGVPSGPYLVLPVFGPSNPRDTAGLIGDVVVYSNVYAEGLDVEPLVLWGAQAVDIVNSRALLLEPLRQAKEASFDYYTFVRNAYLQRRRVAIEGPQPEPKVNGDDLYDDDLYGEDLFEDGPSEPTPDAAPPADSLDADDADDADDVPQT